MYLDGSGNATITTAEVDNGSSDDCSFSLSLSQSSFGCGDVGANTVVLFAEDPAGNISSDTATITVLDTLLPSIIGQDITLSLDSTGTATLIPSDLDGGSSDNCSLTFTANATTFGCGELGDHTVTLYGTDAGGNVDSTTVTVTVVDDMAPVVIAQDVTVALDANGTASISVSDVDAGSFDNCAMTLTLSDSLFECGDLGTQSVTLFAEDASGNRDSATVTITIEDQLAPVVITQNITVTLDANEFASITVADIDNGSFDNCGFVLTLDQTEFSCANVGANTVTLSGTDSAGNVTTATAIVTVVDAVAPTVIAQATTIYLDATGSATLDPASIDNGSSDNCSLTLTVDVSTFGCDNLGTNTVTLIGTDDFGNQDSATTTVTVLDTLAPTVITTTAVVTLDSLGQATLLASQVDGGTSDNCSVTLSVSPNSFTTANLGSNTVTLTATDASGNTATGTATVIVQEFNYTPTFTSTPVTAATEDVGYSYSIAATDQNSNDSLSISGASLPTWLSVTDHGNGTATLSGTPANEDVGTSTITLTVADLAGNSATQSFTLTVANVNDAPVITSSPVTSAAEDVTYSAAISATDVDAGDSLTITATVLPAWLTLTDAGDGTASLTGQPDQDEVGNHDVTLVVTDLAGATAVQSFTITVGNTNDQPTVQGDTLQVADSVSNGFVVGIISAADADGDTLSFSIVSGNLNSAFAIDDAGTITVNNAEALDAATQPVYTLSVSVSDGVLSSQATVIIQVLPTGVTGIPEELLETLTTYPNPTVGVVRIEAEFLADYPEATFVVHNLQGQRMEVEAEPVTAESYQIDLSSMVAGTYLITLQVGETHKRMVVVKY